MTTDVESKDEAGTTATKRPARRAPGGGSPVYALGMIGALVFYWRRADDPPQRVRAVGKALVWPAFVVHDLLRHLER
jgi:hypothetical protein